VAAFPLLLHATAASANADRPTTTINPFNLFTSFPPSVVLLVIGLVMVPDGPELLAFINTDELAFRKVPSSFEVNVDWGSGRRVLPD
jgi:hypothetical protein